MLPLALAAQISTFPYTEDFQGTIIPSTDLPTDWDESGLSTDGIWSTDDAATASSFSFTIPTNSIFAYTNDDACNCDKSADRLITPVFDFTALTAVRIEFDYYTGTAGSDFVEIEISTDSGATFTPIDTLTKVGVWTNQIIDLSAYTGAGFDKVAVSIKYNDAATWGYGVGIDNIIVGAPPTCPFPTALNTSALSTTSANLAWTENGTATNWQIEYDSAGFTQGSGSTVVTTANPYSLTGLTAASSYDWYVRSICGPGDTSAWSAVNSFTTACPAITTFPYQEGFESGVPPACWSENILSGTTSWIANNGNENASVSAFAGSNNAYYYSGNYNGESSQLISPSFDLTSLTNPQLEFYHSQVDWFGDQDTLGVYYRTSSTGSWTLLTSFSGPVLSWSQVVIALPNPSANYSIMFEAWGDWGRGVTLDEFSVRQAPLCPDPTALNTDFAGDSYAILSWTENGTSTQWQIEYDTAGFTQGNGNLVVSNSNPFTISGLTNDTDYDWYVRSICGPADTSAWSLVGSFTTRCAPATAPWTDDVEAHSATTSLSTSLCWIATANNTTNDWNIDGSGSTPSTGTGPSAANSGTNYFYFESSSGTAGNQAYLETPLIDLTALTVPRLEYFYHMYGAANGVMADLYVDVWDGSTFTRVDSLLGEQQTSQADPFLERIVDLSAFTDTILIRFTADWNGAQWGDISLDDFAVVEAPSCPEPTSLTANNITLTSADLDWNEVGSATQWEIEYDTKGFTFGNGNRQFVTANPFTLSGLTPYTTYDYYVRSICGPNDTSAWVSVPHTFIVGQPLAGIYTIDSAQAASTTNFLSFSDFATAINGFGVSAAVTVNVASGTYNNQMSLGTIAGASATNTIVIDGGSASTTEITHDGSLRNSVITLQGSSWLTIKNLTVSSTKAGTDNWGIHMLDSAHHITIDSNEVIMPIATTDDVAGIMASGSEASELTDGENAYDIIISNNSVTGGNWGISIHGDDGLNPRNIGLSVINNTTLFGEDYGINIQGYDGVLVEGNYVDSLNNVNSDALYLDHCENFDVVGNILIGRDNAFDADDLNFDNPVTTKSTVINNFFIGGDDAVFLDDTEEVEFFHNSTYGEDYGIYLNDIAGFEVRNNVFFGETSAAFYLLDSVAIDLDYNSYFSNSPDLARFGPTTAVYADLLAWQTALPTLNINSIEEDPVYFAPTGDLHAQSTAMNDLGDNSVGITTDIDGDTRPLAPSTVVDMGADEYAPPACLTTGNESSFNITDVAADLGWTENGSATEWEVEYGVSGFTQGSTAGTRLVVTNDTISISGLTPLTSYDWYVRAICGPGDTSAWSLTQVFFTDCPATLLTAPYLETFDASSVVTADFNLANVGCWEAIGPGANDIEITTSTDHTGTTIPSAPHIVEFNDGEWPADTSVLVSPAFSDLSSGLNQLRMQVAFESTTASDVSLYVGVMTDPTNTGTFVILDTIDASDVGNQTNFGQVTVDLSNTSLIGSAEYIAIAHGPGIFEAYLDSFIYEVAPVVTPPAPYYPVGTINTVDPNGVADSLNVRVRTSGTVAGVDLDGNNGYIFTIIDMASGFQEGISVFSPVDLSGYTVNEGDSLMLIGEVDQFRGLQQVAVDSIMVIKTNAFLPAPRLVTNLDETTESNLIELTGLRLLDGSGSGSYNMDATNGTDTITIRVDGDTDVNDSLNINPWVAGDTICSIIGIGGQFKFSSPFTSGYQVFPQRFSDIDTTSCQLVSITELEGENAQLSIYPNPTNDVVTIVANRLNTNNARLLIRDLTGKIIFEERLNSNTGFSETLDFSDRANGVYFISIIDGDQMIHEKLIKN